MHPISLAASRTRTSIVTQRRPVSIPRLTTEIERIRNARLIAEIARHQIAVRAAKSPEC